VLGKLARQQDPNVLVGFDKADDAGVYRLSTDTALVQTVDFFTPIVDDPYTFGQIAATNSLSDVYAMGGLPISALAMVCFPAKGDLDVLERILAGGLSKMIEAGCTVIGGHSIRDDEIKFGYAVTGVIHPERVLANSGAKPGDKLLFTKALGTGVISTAIKKQKAEQAWIDAAVRSMTTLNNAAAEVITGGKDDCADQVRQSGRTPDGSTQAIVDESSPRFAAELGWTEASTGGNSSENGRAKFAVHAMTDVTGFGMIGHAREMALASDVSLRIAAERIPLLEGALECIRAGYVPGGLNANREFAECCVAFENAVPDELRTIAFDPQTAGGLLVSVAPQDAERLTRALVQAGVPAVEIGDVVARTTPLITIY